MDKAEQPTITQAEANQGADDDFIELRRLYNYADDNSQQFTRWQMASAIAHGRRLGNTRTTSLAAQDDVTLVEELRAEISNLEAALTQIAGSHWERYGIDQTDIEDVPDLSAEEAMNVARDALSNTPAPSPPAQDGLAEALESAEVILSHYADYLDGISYHELEMHPYIPSVQQTRDDVRKALSAIKEQHHD